MKLSDDRLWIFVAVIISFSWCVYSNPPWMAPSHESQVSLPAIRGMV